VAERLPLGIPGVSRRQGDFAFAAVVAFYDVDGKLVSAPHLCVIGAGAPPQHLRAVEEFLHGRELDAECSAQTVAHPHATLRAAGRRLRQHRLSLQPRRRAHRARPAVGGGMSAARPIGFRVNGRAVEVTVEPRLYLANCMRMHLDLTGPHLGCEHGVCGTSRGSRSAPLPGAGGAGARRRDRNGLQARRAARSWRRCGSLSAGTTRFNAASARRET
jgi:hypothetical protein